MVAPRGLRAYMGSSYHYTQLLYWNLPQGPTKITRGQDLSRPGPLFPYQSYFIPGYKAEGTQSYLPPTKIQAPLKPEETGQRRGPRVSLGALLGNNQARSAHRGRRAAGPTLISVKANEEHT